MVRPLIDILTGYEGAVQEANDDASDENLEALQNARNELMEVLKIALEWEKVQSTPKRREWTGSKDGWDWWG